MNWPVETIPDEDELYFHVHHTKITYNQDDQPILKEAALTNTPEQGHNKSCDWSRYSTPQQTRDRLGQQYRTGKTEFKNPEAFFVYSHGVAEWRYLHHEGTEYPPQKVEHNPKTTSALGSPGNRAHSVIIGDKTEKIRTIMARRAEWQIVPPESKAEMKQLRRSL